MRYLAPLLITILLGCDSSGGSVSISLPDKLNGTLSAGPIFFSDTVRDTWATGERDGKPTEYIIEKEYDATLTISGSINQNGDEVIVVLSKIASGTVSLRRSLEVDGVLEVNEKTTREVNSYDLDLNIATVMKGSYDRDSGILALTQGSRSVSGIVTNESIELRFHPSPEIGWLSYFQNIWRCTAPDLCRVGVAPMAQQFNIRPYPIFFRYE